MEDEVREDGVREEEGRRRRRRKSTMLISDYSESGINDSLQTYSLVLR
jgi:hypothetical protein